jgi:hypothetical protein
LFAARKEERANVGLVATEPALPSEDPALFCLLGVVLAVIISSSQLLGCLLWPIRFLVWLNCLIYTAGWFLCLVGVAWQFRSPATSLGRRLQGIGRLGIYPNPALPPNRSLPLLLPVLGYLLGTAVAFLPDTGGSALAPQYGIVLGIAGGIALAAIAWPFIPVTAQGTVRNPKQQDEMPPYSERDG